MASPPSTEPPHGSGSADPGAAASDALAPEDRAKEKRFLNIIAWVAIIDVALLIPLVWASRWIADRHEIVSVLGPIHGGLFVVLIALCVRGSVEKWWGWWFPAIVVVTLGPLGSLIGDWIIRREMKAEDAGRTGGGDGSGPRAVPS